MDLTEPLGEMFRASAPPESWKRAESQHPAPTSVALNHAVAGGSGRRGIYAENAEEIIARDSRRLRHGNECKAAGHTQPLIFHDMCWREQISSSELTAPP